MWPRADDPRRDLADDDWREINAKLPKWLHSHPYNDMLGDGLPEDERTWAFDFRVMTPTAWWRVPMQTLVQGLPTDAAAQYRIHRMMLQQFQFNRPRKYWVLKGFPRLPAARSSSTPTRTPNSSGCIAIRYRSPRRAR